MRIVSTGDLHFSGGLDEDISISLNYIQEQLRYLNPDLGIIAGDVYDTESDPSGRNRVMAHMKSLAEFCPWIIIYGNHDVPGDLEKFQRIRSKHNIQVISEAKSIWNGEVFHFLPWFTKAGWLATNPGHSEEDAAAAVSDLALGWLRGAVVGNGNENSKHILVSHLTIQGARLQKDQPFKGEGIKFGHDDIRECGIYAGILGHIHLRQEFGDGKIFYNGSPAAMNFGETNQKWFSILDTEKDGVEWYQIPAIDRYSLQAEWRNGLQWVPDVDLDRIYGARVRVNYLMPEGSDAMIVRDEITKFLSPYNPKEIRLNPQIAPKEEVRCANISQATTCAEKLTQYWIATDSTPPADSGNSILRKLSELEGKLTAEGVFVPVDSGMSGTMEPVSLRLRNVMNFDNLTIDFSPLPDGLVAIVGKNGEGKTTILESLFASFYREFPSRPASIYHYCRGKDALIEHTFKSGGHLYKSQLNIDAHSQSMKAYLFRDGDPVTKVRISAFDEEIKKMFGTKAMILSSAYASQEKEGSILSLEVAKRKELFIHMLGMKYLQAMSDSAKAEADSTSRTINTLTGELNILNRTAEKELIDLRMTEIDLRAAEDLVARKREDFVTVSEAISTLTEKVSSQKQALSYAGKRLQDTKGRTDSLLLERINLHARTEELVRKISGKQAAQAAADNIKNHRSTVVLMESQQSEIRAALSEQITKKNSIETKYRKANNDHSTFHNKLLMWSDQIAAAKKAAALIGEVPFKENCATAACKLLSTAITNRTAIPELEKGLSACSKSFDRAKFEVQALEAGLASIEKEMDSTQAQGRELLKRIDSIRDTIQSLQKVADYLPEIEKSEARISELRARLSSIESEIIEAMSHQKEAQREYDRISAEPPVTNQLNSKLSEKSLLETEIKSLENSLEVERLGYYQAKQEADSIVIARQQVSQKRQDRDIMIKDAEEWSRIAIAFGKNGIQSLEIDAAGPGVSSIANDLLYYCYGPRFSVRFRTQRPKADNSGMTDDFDIEVIDSKKLAGERLGRITVGDLSGGEKSIVGEAIRTAIALFNRAKSGQAWDVLMRDETASALDDENGPAYVKMLRRAREIGKFSKVYFILHQKLLKDLADAKIVVANGAVEVI